MCLIDSDISIKRLRRGATAQRRRPLKVSESFHLMEWTSNGGAFIPPELND